MRKNLRRLTTIILSALMILTMFTGCGSSSDKEPAAQDSKSTGEFNPADYPIGFCMTLKSNPVIQTWIAGAAAEAEKLGYPFYVFSVDSDNSAEVIAMADAGIAQHGIKGMCLGPLDSNLTSYAQKWKSQGIATVIAHSFEPEAEDGAIATIACSPTEYGQAAAQEIGKQIGGKGTVAVTCGNYRLNEAEAVDAFVAEMKKSFPNVKVLDPQEEGFDTPIAIQRATSIIQANPDIVGAFSTTGGGPTTWATAQKNAGKKLCIISMDYTLPNLDLVKSGEVHALVAQPSIAEWAKAVDLLDKHFRGEAIDYKQVLPAPLITKDNVDEYYDLVNSTVEIMKKYN